MWPQLEFRVLAAQILEVRGIFFPFFGPFLLHLACLLAMLTTVLKHEAPVHVAAVLYSVKSDNNKNNNSTDTYVVQLS